MAGGRALVVVNETVSGEQLRSSLLSHIGNEVSEVFVLAPALADSALKHTMGDVDDAIEPARQRLEATLAELRKADLRAEGEVGDSDPIQAIGDEILKFDPERIIVVAHRDEEGAFAEKGLLEQAERDFDLPVLELVVDRSAEPNVLDVKSSEPVAGRRRAGSPPTTGRRCRGARWAGSWWRSSARWRSACSPPRASPIRAAAATTRKGASAPKPWRRS